jgi:hypothetical protein
VRLCGSEAVLSKGSVVPARRVSVSVEVGLCFFDTRQYIYLQLHFFGLYGVRSD